ncbi:hypothetical protein PIB30_061390 [Stylosanthes scabra]|uniref:Uncharacterized protein n=1 Tax=Stylosanthes scabra TaxID=79078 RepID=A0ABU6QKP9_9FABA|nr:hypothetical protein [Stylosanthes scabra]
MSTRMSSLESRMKQQEIAFENNIVLQTYWVNDAIFYLWSGLVNYLELMLLYLETATPICFKHKVCVIGLR